MSKYSASGAAWQAQRLRVLNRDGWVCVYCGKALEGRDAHVDHISPISLSPDHDYTDDDLTSSCARCNTTKGAQVLTRLPYWNERWLPNGLR